MTFEEWSAAISAELKAAGFPVDNFHGFPLVPMPATQPEIVRLLKFRTKQPVNREIYAEGMIFLPATQSTLRDAAEPGKADV